MRRALLDREGITGLSLRQAGEFVRGSTYTRAGTRPNNKRGYSSQVAAVSQQNLLGL